MASPTPSLLRPTAGTTAAASVASTSYRAGLALRSRHSRRAFTANATPGDGNSGENDEQANRKQATIAVAAAAAAASSLLAARPAAALEHPIEGGWRHGLRPRRHLRAMGEFERDRLLRVRVRKIYENLTTWLCLSLRSRSLSSQKTPPHTATKHQTKNKTGRAPRRAEHEGL